MQIWFQEDFRNFWDACPWEEDLEYCRAVCSRLGVSKAGGQHHADTATVAADPQD